MNGNTATAEQPRSTQARTRYRMLAQLSPVGIFHTDAEGRCCYVNRQWSRLAGLSLRQARGDGWAAALHPDDAQRVAGEWARCARGRHSFQSEYRFRRGDGQVVWVLGQAVPEHDECGQVIGFVGTVTDITRQKKAEEELRRSEQTYLALSECAGVGISHLDLDGTTLYINAAMRAMLELEPGENVHGLKYDQFFTADSSRRIALELRRRSAGVISTYEAELVGRRGTRRLVVISGAPVLGPDGRVESAIGTIIDITDRRRAELALQGAHDELEARVRLRTAELERANRSLEKQIEQRHEAEQALKESERHYREAAEHNRRLVLELDHRVRNNLAGLLSLLSLTRAKAHDLRSFSHAIESRLLAMARVHDALAASGWQPVKLRAMLSSLLDTLRPLCNEGPELRLEGDDVAMETRQTLPIMMIVQEWFTNSCKHGALSCPLGRVRIAWEVPAGQNGHIRLRWTESGGPPVVPPSRTSLGTDLVNAFVTRELRGNCRMSYPPDGADHLIEFPAVGEQ